MTTVRERNPSISDHPIDPERRAKLEVEELREIVREMWARVMRLEDELAGQHIEIEDDD